MKDVDSQGCAPWGDGQHVGTVLSAHFCYKHKTAFNIKSIIKLMTHKNAPDIMLHFYKGVKI